MSELFPFQTWHEEAKLEPKKVYLAVMQYLEKIIRDKAEVAGFPRHDHSFSRALDFLKQGRSLSHDQAIRLAHYWDIRNSLVHNAGLTVELALVEDVLAYAHNSLRRQAERAGDFMTPFVITVPENATFNQAIKIMSARNFSQLPILRKKQIVTLLTRRDIVELLSQEESEKLKDLSLEACLKKIKKRPDNFILVSFETSIEEVLQHFKRDSLLEAVIVTAQGQATETPQGIITPADFVSLVS